MTAFTLVAPFIVYVLVVNIASLLARSGETEDNYAMGGRRFSALYVSFGLFTLIGAGEITAMPALGVSIGWSAVSLFVGYTVSFVFLAFFVGAIRSGVSEDRPLSLPDFMRKKFGDTVFAIVLGITILALFALLTLQFAVLGLLAEALVPWPPETVIAGCALAAVSYLYVGGYRAVMITDVIQGIAMLVLLPLLLIVVILRADELDVQKLLLVSNPGWTYWVGVLVSGFFGGLVGADVWQRIYSARSNVEARRGLILGAALFLFYGVLLTAVGVVVGATGYSGNADGALAHFITNEVPVWATPLLVLLLLCIVLSTADTEMFLVGTMLNRLTILPHRRGTVPTVAGARLWITAVAVGAAYTASVTSGYGFPAFKLLPDLAIESSSIAWIQCAFVITIIVHHLRVFFGVSLVHDWEPQANPSHFDHYKRIHVFVFLITYPIFPYLAKYEDVPYFLALWAFQLVLALAFTIFAIATKKLDYLKLETIAVDLALVALWLTFLRYALPDWVPAWLLTVSDGDWLGLALLACFATVFFFLKELGFYWGPGRMVVASSIAGLRPSLVSLYRGSVSALWNSRARMSAVN